MSVMSVQVEIDLGGTVCKVGVEVSEPVAVCQRKDKLNNL